MSTTFSYVIFPHHRRKDGTITVKIRMIHNSVVRYCSTAVCVTKEQLTKRMDRITDPRILEAVNVKLDEYRQRAALTPNAEYLSADRLWNIVRGEIRQEHVFELDVFDYTRLKMRSMEAKTAEGYKSMLSMLGRYLGREQLDINDITYKWLLGFRAFIEEQTSKGSRAVSYYLSCLRHIHNLAREEYNDEEVREPRIPRQPFRRGLIPPQPATKHRTLTVEQLRSVIAYEPVTDRQRVAKDVFVLSFALIGMNTVDLYHLTSDSLTDGVINYNRCKTDSKRNDKALMRVRVEPEAERLILQHKGRRALLDFADRYANHRNFNKAVNKGLDEIQTALGIDDLSSYYARHTWATLARNACGIDRSTVDEALNHASRPDERLLDIYVERDWSRVWDANRKVLNYVFGLG